MSLSRNTPLKRKSPMRRKRPRRLSRPGSDPEYVAWIHTHPCVDAIGHTHHGRVEQSHARNMTGMGRKEPDARSIPMCLGLHRDREQHRGPFLGWFKEQRRVWFEARIIEQNARYRMDGGVLP